MNESLIESTPFPLPSHPNSTQPEPEYVYPEVPLYVEMVLMVIGTIGNILVCLAIILDKKLQHSTNFFLVSLAATDLLITVTIMPARLTMNNLVLEPSSFGWCFFYLIAANYFTAASALHICIISMERFLAIRKPLGTRNKSNRRFYVKLALPWLITSLWVIPYAHVILTSEHPNRPLHCFNTLKSTNTLRVSLCSELPLLIFMIAVVVVSFIGTSVLLHKKAKKQSASGTEHGTGLVRTVGGNKSENSSKSQQLNTEKKAIRAVLLVSLGFIVTMVPYVILITTYLIAPQRVRGSFLIKVVSFAVRCNSVINPILYTIFNRQFRNNFKNILLFRCKKLSEIK